MSPQFELPHAARLRHLLSSTLTHIHVQLIADHFAELPRAIESALHDRSVHVHNDRARAAREGLLLAHRQVGIRDVCALAFGAALEGA